MSVYYRPLHEPADKVRENHSFGGRRLPSSSNTTIKNTALATGCDEFVLLVAGFPLCLK